MIRFKCPKCASSLAVKEAKAGALGLCPSCGTKVRVPQGPAPSPPPSPPAPEPSALAARPEPEDVPGAYGFESPLDPPPAPRPQPVKEQRAERDEDEPTEEVRPARKKARRTKGRARKDRAALDFSPFLWVAGVVGLFLILAGLSFLVPGLGYVTAGLGYAIGFAGWIWFLVIAFQESIGWGLACLLIPCVSLIFLVTHLDQALKPFLVNLGGGVLVFIGMTALAMQH
jgi:hypothetical protein